MTAQVKKLPELSREPNLTYRHWGKLYAVHIPHSCQHPKQVPLFPAVGIKQKQTCGVFVSFSGVIDPQTPYESLAYRAWDDAERSGDHVYLYVKRAQAWRGVTVYGVPGHTVMLEITHR